MQLCTSTSVIYTSEYTTSPTLENLATFLGRLIHPTYFSSSRPFFLMEGCGPVTRLITYVVLPTETTSLILPEYPAPPTLLSGRVSQTKMYTSTIHPTLLYIYNSTRISLKAEQLAPHTSRLWQPSSPQQQATINEWLGVRCTCT